MIGGCDQGEGPVVVVGVQWFLLNADVMPGGKENRNLSLLLSFTALPPHPPFPPPFLLITFHTFRNKTKRAEPTLFIKKETWEQKHTSDINERGPRWCR